MNTVTHFVDSLDPRRGGPSRSVPSLVRALVDEGTDARLHVADINGHPSDVPIQSVVHDHGLWLPSNHRVIRMARRCGTPLVITPRGMLEPWALSHRKLKKKVAWTLYQKRDLSAATALHATSVAEEQSIRGVGIDAPVAIIPNGVDSPAVLPKRTRQKRRRALFLGRIHPIKGLELLVDAWSRLDPDGWELTIVGPDEDGHRAELERLAAGAPGNAKIQFRGSVSDEDKWALYRSADLFVLPSRSENFGIVVAEALSAGVPVITTTSTPWSELVAEECGWWVDVTSEAILYALNEATSMPQQRLEQAGQKGREYAMRSFGWNHIAHRMASFYSWLLGRGEKPGFVHLP